jgi:proteasome lid subunit RPN8/RPN11
MITIADEQLNEIREHGVRDHPYECCGLLLGRFTAEGKIVQETYPISNAREESAKRDRFLITPEELMRGERYARDGDLEVVGFYHSHPDCPAVPSQYDLFVHHRFDDRGRGEGSFFVGTRAGSVEIQSGRNPRNPRLKSQRSNYASHNLNTGAAQTVCRWTVADQC